MSSSSSEEEFELNYVKIDSKNDIRILDQEDYFLETVSYSSAISDFEQEKIGKNLLSFLKKLIPDTTDNSKDILKANLDYIKQYFKKINSDKKVFNATVNEILSTDFKDLFIFNKINLHHICNVLAYGINELRKYKISTAKDFTDAISQINLKKYDLFKIYSNHDYLKNKDKNAYSRGSSQCMSTAYSSNSNPFKDLYEDIDLEDNNLLDLNRYHNEARGIHYIDMNQRNIMFSSMLTNDYNYNEEEELKKLLTKECFNYPKANKNTLSEKELTLPIEIIILLDKLQKVKTLIFQI